jgi:hypothetical protein
VRTTLDIDDDVLAAARELARRQGTSAGQMVSRLLRAALNGSAFPQPPAAASPRVAGFRPFPARAGQVVSNDQIDQLRDEAGLCCPGPCSTSTW